MNQPLSGFDPFAKKPNGLEGFDPIAKKPNGLEGFDPIASRPVASSGQRPLLAKKPTPKGRTWGDAVGDTAKDLASGAGGLVQGVGTLYGLATGNMDNVATKLGKDAQDYWQERQSDQLKADKQARSEAIDSADGMLGKAVTAVTETVKNPRLLTSTIAENAATFIPAGAAGRAGAVVSGTRALANATAKGASKAVAERVAARVGARVGTAAAIGTGAVQQGADVAQGTYDAALEKDDATWQANQEYTQRVAAGEQPDAVKHDLATQAARAAFLPAAGISVLTQKLPGGAVAERWAAGAAQKASTIGGKQLGGVAARGVNAAKGIAGEGLQETLEEGGGQFAANVASRAIVDPSQALDEGVGESAGMGFVGGAGLGGATGFMSKPHARRPVARTQPQPVPQAAPAGPITQASSDAPLNVTPPAQQEQPFPSAPPGGLTDAANALPRTAARPVPSVNAAAQRPEPLVDTSTGEIMAPLEGDGTPQTVTRWLDKAGAARAPSLDEAAAYLREKLIADGFEQTRTANKKNIRALVEADGEMLEAKVFNKALDTAARSLVREMDAQAAATQPQAMAGPSGQQETDASGQTDAVEGGGLASAMPAEPAAVAQQADIQAGEPQAEVAPTTNLTEVSSNPLESVSDLPFMQIGDMSAGQELTRSMVGEDDWRKLKEAGFVDTAQSEDGTPYEYVYPPKLYDERERRYQAERARAKAERGLDAAANASLPVATETSATPEAMGDAPSAEAVPRASARTDIENGGNDARADTDALPTDSVTHVPSSGPMLEESAGGAADVRPFGKKAEERLTRSEWDGLSAAGRGEALSMAGIKNLPASAEYNEMSQAHWRALGPVVRGIKSRSQGVGTPASEARSGGETKSNTESPVHIQHYGKDVDPADLVKMHGVRGRPVYVHKDALADESKSLLPMYVSSGRPNRKDGRHQTIHRGNLRQEGERSTRPGLPYYAASTRSGERPFKTANNARKAVTGDGQNLDDYEIKEHGGGFVAVRKPKADERETVDPTTDPVVGDDIHGMPIRKSKAGTFYTIENGRVRTGPAFAGVAPELASNAVPPSSTMADDAFNANLPAYVAQYRALAEEKTGNPDYYNADLAKELFPEYSASNDARRENNEKVASRASKIAFTAFEQRLAEPVTAGNEGVTLMAGGTGSGKSVLRPESGVVYDSTMYDSVSARRNVEKVLASGRAVNYSYVFATPESAFLAAISRGKEHGRYVNLTAFVRTHEGAYRAVDDMMREYAADARVTFEVFENTDFAGKKVESIPDYDYNGLRERLEAILDEEYTAGRVSADEYRAIARTEPRALARGSEEGSRAPKDRRPEQSEGLVGAPKAAPKGEVLDPDAALANFRAEMDSLSDRAFAAGDGKESGRIASAKALWKSGEATQEQLDEIIASTRKRVERIEKRAGAATAGEPDRFANNKIFTADKVEAARARIKAKLGTLNSGVDPEMLMDGMTIAGAYIENGVRTFADYAKAMVDDLGEGIKPYLLSFYEGVRHFPSVETEGMDSPDDAARAFDALLTPADIQNDAVGNAKPPRKTRPAAKTERGARTLKDDFGVDRIDGYGDAERETGNSIKDEFIREATSYLKAVADALEGHGFTVTLNSKGKPDKAVTSNAGGAAGSGDVMLHMVSDNGTGIYVHVGESALRGTVPTTASGIAMMYRTTDGTRGQSGRNQWARVDLSADELAAELAAHVRNNPWNSGSNKGELPHLNTNGDDGGTISPKAESAQQETEHETGRKESVVRADPEGAGDAGGRVRTGDSSVRSGNDSAPGRAEHATRVGAMESENVRTPEEGRDGGDAGEGAGGASLRDEGRTGGGGDAVHGRARTSRPRSADARSRVEAADLFAGADAPVEQPRAQAKDSAPKDPEPVKNTKTASPAYAGPGDFVIEDPAAIQGGGQVARFNKNKAAIELRNRLMDEGRAATREEQGVLAGYTGWGSFGQELFQGSWDRPSPKDGWEARDAWLRDNLGQREWEGMQASIINAHYTDPPTVRAMWDMVSHMGFTHGRVLEPSIGIGNFFGMMPVEMASRSDRAGIELDPVTGSMAKLLYPSANIQIRGYETSKTPDNFYDLVIGNWPFFEKGPADRRYNRLNPTLHDYFFLKALDQTRPGGVVIGITTHGSMDKKSVTARMELARKGELIAAFRLPTGAFQEYAGTKVVTDIVILRKRETPVAHPTDSWTETSEVETPSGEKVRINNYFKEHPDHVIGTIDFGHGTTFGRAGLIVHRPENMLEQLERIVALVPEGAFKADNATQRVSYLANHTDERTGALVEQNGEIMLVQGDHLVRADDKKRFSVKSEKATAQRKKEITDLIAMRRLYGALITAQRDGDATKERDALRKAFEAFKKEHGSYSDSFGLSYFERVEDPFHPALASLELKDKDGNLKPAAILSANTMRGAMRMENPTIADAFVLARIENVSPTLDRVAAIAGRSIEDVTQALTESGAGFVLPNGDFAPSDIYLSGNVREKLREALAAQGEGNTEMQRNIDALREVVPKDTPYYKIEAQMGATWVTPTIYADYVAHMLGLNTAEEINATFKNGAWKVEFPSRFNKLPQAMSGFGSKNTSFKRLVNAAISNQSITVRQKDRDGTVYVDTEATTEVNAQISDMRAKFAEWLWSDPTRREQMEREYNEVRNAYATPKFDGSFMPMEGMALSLGNGPFNLRQHQMNAIWRGVVMQKSLNAHEVGTGKTFTIGGIAVESRRYGVAKKPLLFAHNANSASVAKEVLQMYPAAKVLYVDNLSKADIKVRMQQIANDDWDLVVMPHSLIDRVGLKKETLDALAREQIIELTNEAEEAADEDGVKLTSKMLESEEELKKLRSPTAKQLVKQIFAIRANIEKMAQAASREDAIAFEDLGVDMILVDEAHEFKKPPIATKMRMKGLQTQTSAQATALKFIVDYVRGQHGGKNVHLFTGTPITNTMTEIFHMMRYIMSEEMAATGVDTWDGWFGSFAREVSDVELTSAGEYEAVTRLQSFINVPELRKMVGQYMDVVFADDMPEMQPRKVNGKTLADPTLTEAERGEILNGRTPGAKDRPYKKVINENSDMSPAQLAVFDRVQMLARRWKDMSGRERREAMQRGAPEVPIIHGRIAETASFDVRLVDAIENAGKEGTPEMEPDANSKPARVVKNLIEIYNSSQDAAQVVFMESGVSNVVTRQVGPTGNKVAVRYKAFSTRDDMIERLVQQGIPREQIAVVDGKTSKERRKEIADAMNDGRLRIVFGSTQSLGVGVNMQKNLRAMHHMDAPWMPGELEQRNGRGHRQGNQWNTVLEYRYLTDRIDGKRWQTLAIKQRFITAFMRANNDDVRVIEGDAADDSDGDIISTFAEAAGDPRMLLREKYKRKLEALQSRERLHGQAQADAKRSVMRNMQLAATARAELPAIKASANDAMRVVESNRGNAFGVTLFGKRYDNRDKANEAIEAWAEKNMRIGDEKEVGTYGGRALFVEWNRLASTPNLLIRIDGNKWLRNKSLSIGGIDATLRHYGGSAATEQETHIANIERAIAHAETVLKEPFHLADKLADMQKRLDDVETDLAANPVAPPLWLRTGAPTDSAVYWNGKEFAVTGHRWDNEGYWVLAADDKGAVVIPYLSAKDGQGMALYEAHEHTQPVVNNAKAQGDGDAGAPVDTGQGSVARFSKSSGSDGFSEEGRKQFRETERAYGGREAYDKAKADGKTKLTFGQWVQVRTAAFKKWFGDWEALRAQQRLDAMEPVKVRVPDDWRGLTHVELRQKMAEALDRLVRDRVEIEHPEIGTIRVGRTGASKSVNTARDPAKSLVAADIEALIPASIYARSEPSRGGDGKDIDGYSTLLAPVDVDGVHLIAAFTVRQQSDGRWYYNAVTLHDGQEKARDSYERPDQNGSSDAPIAGLANFVRRPLVRVNLGDVSKVVDQETGEPMVVYHGSTSDISVFDTSNTKAAGVIFTTPSAEGASIYAQTKGNGGAPNVMPLFVSVKSPAHINEDDYGFDALQAAVSRGRTDGVLVTALDGEIKIAAPIDSNQIKSATANNGEFSADPNILRSRAKVTAAGLSMAEGQQLKQKHTARWGKGAPNVVLVESAEDLQAAARAAGVELDDMNADRAEGLYLGTPTVWLNLAAISNEQRFIEVLAHEALGHYGVEQVVGKAEWRSIIAAITRHVENKTGGEAILKAIARLRDNQPEIFEIANATERNEVVAKEVIAVLAEQGNRNGLMQRIVAAVRRFLRRMMPSVTWSDGGLLGLLTQAESFLHKSSGRNNQKGFVRAHAFSQTTAQGGSELDVRALSPEQVELLRSMGMMTDEQNDLLAATDKDAEARTAARRVLRGINATTTKAQIDAQLKLLARVKARLKDLTPAVSLPDIDGEMTPAFKERITQLGAFLQGYAKNNEQAFDYGTAPKGETDIQKIADAMLAARKDVPPTFTQGQTDSAGVEHWTIRTRDGKEGKFEVEPDGTLQLHIGELAKNSGEGSALYAVFNAWAARNGYVAASDRAGLSEVNKYRRTASMLSSALREGSTAHLLPHESQALPHWERGESARAATFNIGYMALREAKRVLDPRADKLRIPLLNKVRYNFKQNIFVDSKGRGISVGEYGAILSQAAAGQGAVGGRSAQRAGFVAASWAELERRGMPASSDAQSLGGAIAHASAEPGLRVATDSPGHAAGDSNPLVLDAPQTLNRAFYSKTAKEKAGDEEPRKAPARRKSTADVEADIERIIQRANEGATGAGSQIAQVKQWLKDATPKQLKDRLRSTWLKLLTTRMLTELGADYDANTKHYSDYLAEMEADRNTLQQEGVDLAEDVRSWASKNRDEAGRLFDLMHEATIQGSDPAEDYAPMTFKFGKKAYEVNKDNVKEAIVAIREQMRGRAGDDKREMMREIKDLRAMLAAEPHRAARHPKLAEKFAALSPEAQGYYRLMRDMYKKRFDDTEQALINRINDLQLEGGEKRKQAMVNIIRQQFESQRLQGVYFPLERHGDYFVSAKKDGVTFFTLYESGKELERAVKSMRADGVEILATGRKADSKSNDAPSGTFVADVMDLLQKSGVSNETRDEVYQVYLRALPELSMRKHRIHRRAVPGWDTDALRAFAYNMHHGAYQLARLRYSHKLGDVLTLLRAKQENKRRAKDADVAKIIAGDEILNELAARHEWISNPQDSSVTNLVSSFGFTYYLGLTPAAALVNMTQVPMLAYPFLASRYGHGRAIKELFRAMKATMRTFGSIQRTLTSEEELRAHKAMQVSGALDKTNTHNLAGIAEGGLVGYNPTYAKAMDYVSKPFHVAEVMNRETTGMAAFRLARADGKSFEDAVKFAVDAINETMFDYSNANRARFMQSGTAKVLLMFRQYSLNMTWHMARMLWNATNSADPEVKKIARRNLTGVLGMSALFSGALGLPLMSVIMGVLNGVAASAGDDDEPFDAETEFRKFLISMLGENAARVALHGAVNELGADIASRVSYSDLWFRDADRELDGRGAYYNLLEQAAGPMGGVLKNALVGKQMMDEGHLMRGVETVMPKAIKDVIKAGRYATEGVNTLRGDPLIEDVGFNKVLMQLIGFTPAEVSERYDMNRALMNYQKNVQDRRKYLMNSFAMAVRTDNASARAESLKAIQAFNAKWPEIAINSQSLQRSLRARANYSAMAEGGVALNRRIAGRVREAVGAE